MDWIRWLIPVVVVAVYILSHLVKDREETRRTLRPPVPPPLPPQEGGDRPRRPPSEVDRFLEAVRRREAAAKAPVSAAALEPKAAVPPVRPALERSRPPSQLPTPVVTRPRRPGSEEPPKPQPPRRPAAGETIPVVKLAPVPAPPTPVDQVAVHLAAPAKPVSPAAQQLLELLKNPLSLRTAILLREVLDRPRCQRPRRY